MRNDDFGSLLKRLTALCARSEHSSGEMAEKMRRWQVEPQLQAQLMQYLTEHGFVDDERYARAFVRDKLLYNHWGRAKTDMALRAKGVNEDIRRQALDDIADDDYTEQLRPLLQQKARQDSLLVSGCSGGHVGRWLDSGRQQVLT